VRDAALLIGHFKPRTRTDLLDPELRPHAEFALGGNLRLSPLAAALALDHVRRLDQLRTAKLANVSVLDDAISGRLRSFAAFGERVNGTQSRGNSPWG
jgi:perosamine synthetase